MTDRRTFLKLSGSTLLLLGGGGPRAVAAALAKDPAPGAGRGVLVCFFQRGAADGLAALVPYRDGRYRALRGSLALPEPGTGEDRPIDAGDGFAIHPALADLAPLYRAGRLALVPCAGSPDGTRSHFDAQDYMESGTPGDKGTRDGWLARALAAVESAGMEGTPFSAIGIASTMPRSLSGARHALAMQDFSRMRTRAAASESLEERIARMYETDPAPGFAEAGAEAFDALATFRLKDPLSMPARTGVTYPRGRVGESFRQLACLLKGGLGVRIAFLEGGGWDTHFNQGAATGSLASNLRELGGCLAALVADVGADVPVTVLTVSEFGRTVRVNGSGGTDHGHGTTMMVLGAKVRGGRVTGAFPGLSDLYEGRDLPVTTDFRDLFSEVATAALSLPAGTKLFPGHESPKPVGVMS